VLVLFDIDGTLLRGATGEHTEALYAALAEVHRVDAERFGRNIQHGGRTDGEIARLILLEAGVSALRIDSLASEVREACCRIYAGLCPPDISDTVIPGLPALLARLAESDGVTLALLTGNFEPVARLKLKRAGIGRFFARGLGAFGSDSEDRAALPAIARRRSGTNGVPVARERTIVIGDTPRDIACARADRVGCVAVATGSFGVDALVGADAVARDAGELQEKLAALGAA
jgi:phosphoglycolate phosphatase